MTKSTLRTALNAAITLAAVSILIGAFLGQPILLAYVETGSMEPTIDAGDGFVAVPAFLSGDIEEGDVVVYDAEEIEGGGLTTHRVVGETERGYITKGDANPFTDQDSKEPPVRDEQIVATALSVGGTVIVIPHLGTAIMTLQDGASAVQQALEPLFGLAGPPGSRGGSYLLIAVGLGFVALGALLNRGRRPERRPSRDRKWRASYRTRRIVVGVVLVMAVAATASMVVSSGAVTYGLLATDSTIQAEDDPLIVDAGGETTVSHSVSNDGLVPVVVVRESADSGVTVEPRATVIGPRSTAETSVHVVAPDEPTRFDRTVEERRYLALLPPSLVVALHDVHPWVAILAIDVVVATGVAAVGASLTKTERMRFRTGAPTRSIRTRTERLLRRFFSSK